MMLRRISVVILFLALAGLVAAPNSVQAQEETEPWDTDYDSFNSLLEAIDNSDEQISALEQQDVQNIQLVNIDEIRSDLDETQEQRLDQALEDANTEELHRALNQNENVTATLEDETQENVNVMDVVAINVLENGDVVVYHEPVM